MTTTPQTEASRLADELRAELLVDIGSPYKTTNVSKRLVDDSAAELRRLVAENQRQRADLERKSEAIQKLWAERDQLRAQVERLQATEPFGYFRAEPFGWTDCAATDEGAIALYERPAAPAVPQGVPVMWVMRAHETGQLNPARPHQKAKHPKIWSDAFPLYAATPAAPSQELVKRPQNCGTSFCSCIECVCEPSQTVTLTDSSVDAAAKILAERFDYPWTYMPEQGRNSMRETVRAIIAALREKEKAK